MRFFKHKNTNDPFLLPSDAPEWSHIHVDGRHSKEARTPMYCRLVPSGEIALVHIAQWVYTDILTEIGEEEARRLDRALVERIASLDPNQEPALIKRTKYYGFLSSSPAAPNITDPSKRVSQE